MTTYPDHLIIVAPTLEAGSAFVMDTLGVSPQMGGKHEKMGTHNMLLRLGEFLYLEIIAPDRAAPNPNRPRWFNMDQVNHHSSPALLTWAVRTSDIEKTSAGSLQPLGVIESMSRGDLNWLITVAADGSIAHDGLAPALISWTGTSHPASGLEDKGVRLNRLELISHQPKLTTSLLSSIGFDKSAPVFVRPASVDQPKGLIAYFQTPAGLVKIGP